MNLMPKKETKIDCGCQDGGCESSRRQFLSRGAQSIAAIGIAAQSGKALAKPAVVKPKGWIPTGFTQTRDLAADADSRIYIAGDSAVMVIDPGGNEDRRIEFQQAPYCVAVDMGGIVAVGFRDFVAVCDSLGREMARTACLNRKAWLTSVAFSDDGKIYAADSGTGSIWRLDKNGKVLDRLSGGKGGKFAVPKAFFPITWSRGNLIVAHPGRHRVERYDADGGLLARWGKRSRNIDGFSGCCNPISVAALDNGDYVTAERGQPRIKLFGQDGRFKSLIAGPEQFEPGEHEKVDTEAELAICQNGGIEVAVDSAGRIVALDHTTAAFRLFDLS